MLLSLVAVPLLSFSQRIRLVAISPGLRLVSKEETCLNLRDPREEPVRSTSYVSSVTFLSSEGLESFLFGELSECFAIKSAASSTGLLRLDDVELGGVGQFRARIKDRREAPTCVGEKSESLSFSS